MSEEVKATPVLSPEQELLEAKNRLEAAKARLAETERLRLSALQAKVAAINAERERKEAAEKAERDRIEQAHIDRKRAEQEEEAARQRQEAAKNAELQRQLAAQEEVVRKQQAHDAEVARIAAEAQAIEAAAQAAQAAALADLDFIEAGVATKEVTPSATEDSSGERHPLRRFQQRTDIYTTDAPAPATDGISSEQTSLAQMRLDAIENESHPVYAQKPAPVTAPVVPPVSGRKAKAEVDYAASGDLENLLRRELHITVSTTKLDALSAAFTYDALMTAAHKSIARFKTQPMSADSLIVMIETYADAPQTVAVSTPTTAQPGATVGGGM